MKKANTMVAKVNKEIGGWDYRGYHIDRDNNIKAYTIQICGDEVCAKTLGKAKEIIDNEIEAMLVRENEELTAIEQVEQAQQAGDDNVITFTSKRGTMYLLQVIGDTVKAFTYEAGKKHYWTVTQEIRQFAGLA